MIDLKAVKGQAAYWPLIEIAQILEEQAKKIAELEQKLEERRKPGRPPLQKVA